MIVTIVVNVLLLSLFGWHLLRAYRTWQDYADVRSLRYAVQALLLLIGAVGLSLGAVVVQDPDQGAAIQSMRFIIGFSRSVLLIGGIYLLASWRRR